MMTLPRVTAALSLLALLSMTGCNGDQSEATTAVGDAGEPTATQAATTTTASNETPPADTQEQLPPPHMTLYRAVGANDIEQMKANIQHGADLNQFVQDSTGGYFTPMHSAARMGNLEAIKLLVEAGAEINIPARAPHNAMPLHWAVRAKHLEVVKYLIENGADINAPSGLNNETSPLGWAVNVSAHDIAAYLHEQGAQMEPAWSH